MAWTDGWPLMVLAVVGLTLLQGVIHAASRSNTKENVLWTKLDAVGVASSGPFPWARAIAASIIATRTFANEGYARFCKALDQPYALPTTWTGKAVVVVPPSQMHRLLTRPDKQADSEITNIPGLVETVQMPFVIGDPDIYQNTIHFDVVRRKMAKRDMHFFAPITEDEVGLAYEDIWGTSEEWRTINGWDACGQVIARTAQRILIGLPLGRDEKLLETSRLYANAVLLGGALMNCFPPSLRMFVGPLIALRARYFQTLCVSMLVPIVDDRLRIFCAPQQDEKVPEDFLQWLIATAAKGGPDQLNSTRIANRLIALMTPLIFAVCYVFSHAVLDIYASLDKDEFISGLYAECKEVSEKHNGLGTAEAVDSLYRIDSAIRESMRTSDVAVTNLFRDVTAGGVDLGHGVTVTKGTRMAFPTQNIHMDPEYYEDPEKFDAFRFSRGFEMLDEASLQARAQERELVVTPTLSFFPLGYGRHACPGRWFAAQTMKQALAYIVLNYDVELIGKPITRKALVNTMVPPVDSKMRIRRKLLWVYVWSWVGGIWKLGARTLTGVSWLRVSDGRDFPKEAVPVVFATSKSGSSGSANGGSTSPPPQNSTAPAAGGNSTSAAAADGGSGFFVAADPDLNFYYPVVCTYTTNTPPRLFVVADPVAGVSMLQTSDIVYSITGGFVDTCAVMPIVQGKYAGDVENEFGEYDDEIDA